MLILLAAVVLLSLAVPTLQQPDDEGDPRRPPQQRSRESDATEARFASGAKAAESEEDRDAAAIEAALEEAADEPPEQPRQQRPAATEQQPAVAAGHPTRPSKKSKIVEIAPEADVQNEVDDIDVKGGELQLRWLRVVGLRQLLLVLLHACARWRLVPLVQHHIGEGMADGRRQLEGSTTHQPGALKKRAARHIAPSMCI